MNIPTNRQALATNFILSLKRFPIAIGFNALLTLVLLYNLWNDSWDNKLSATSIYYLSVGFLLSLSLKIWNEEVKNKTITRVTAIALHTILFIDALYLYFNQDMASSWTEIGLARTSAICALCASMTILPFYREKNDIAAWNFTLLSIGYWGLAVVISHLMLGGISLLMSSLESLFNLHIHYKLYTTTWVICATFLSPILFLGLLPYGEKKTNRVPISVVFINKTIRYLFLPLLCLYLAVLYVYATKILIAQELPNGWVSKLVSALMAGCIAIQFWLYPSVQQKSNWLEKQIVRWLPILTLPLLFLMTLGIARRISDYGITINRLYLSALNAWFYIVCIGLIINKGKRIHWIPLSFATVFLLTSILPVNFTSITRNTLLKEIRSEVHSTYTGPLPMDETTYSNWLKTYPQEKALEINSKIRYLDEHFGKESISQLFNDANWFSIGYNIESQTKPSFYSFKRTSTNWSIDLSEGYSTITFYNDEIIKDLKEDETIVISFPQENEDAVSFSIKISDIKQWDKIKKEEWQPVELSGTSSAYRFFLSDYSYKNIATNDNLYMFIYSGYLLKKQL
jgi:hypothetical protein